MTPSCQHVREISVVEPGERVCPECVREGTGWVALHLCTSCGHVGCCVSSPGAHAKRHWQETGHPVIRSTERGWFWCYPDEDYVEPAPHPGLERPGAAGAVGSSARSG